MRKLLLLAWPAAHSISPGMQNAALEATAFPARYSAWAVPPDQLPEAVARLRESDVLGANVTIPHKQAVIPLLDALTPAALSIGAVNTISNHAGRLTGHNTDGSGFLAALAETGFVPRGRRVVLLGAGGAARAVLHALLSAGAQQVLVSNRTRASAEGLARDFAPAGAVGVLDDSGLAEAVAACDLLVNTTSVGMGDASSAPQVSPLPAAVLPEAGLVVDLIYRPARTLLLQRAEEAGLQVQNGLPMLVQQGAEAFAVWTGREPPLDVMRRAAGRLLQQ